MNETIWEPVILSVSLTPNPTKVGETVIIAIKAVDVFGREQEELRLCGEWLCGDE